MIGTEAWVQVVSDDARAQGGSEPAEPGGRPRVWEQERDRERARPLPCWRQLSLSSGRSSPAPRPRGARARSIARDVDAKSMVDEVPVFYVKATGEDGVQIRQKLANMKPAALQQCRERSQKRAEEVQRSQDKKEEAWTLFRRQGDLIRKTRDDFEREFKHQVMRSLDRNSKEDEKSLNKWTGELRLKAEAEEIQKMKEEDVRSRKLRSGGR